MEEDYVLDLGSNDGIFLKNFAQKNIKHTVLMHLKMWFKNLKIKELTQSALFNNQLTKKIHKSMGSAKVIKVQTQCTILKNVMKYFQVCDLLSEDGIIIIEDPYLLDMLDLASFEQIYAEHNIWA